MGKKTALGDGSRSAGTHPSSRTLISMAEVEGAPTINEPTAKVHARYSAPDADLVLLSEDDVHFRVHSLILRLASDGFSGMLEVGARRESDIVRLSEKSKIIEAMLDLIYPNGFAPKLSDVSFVRDLASCLEKYIIPSASDIIRKLAFSAPSSPLLDSHPLDMYEIASTHRWVAEMKTASTATLSRNVTTKAGWGILLKLEASSLVKVLQLHQQRHDLILAAMTAIARRPAKTTAASPPATSPVRLYLEDLHTDRSPNIACALANLHGLDANAPWNALKYQISRHMKECSRGDNIRKADFWNLGLFSTLWDQRCSSCKWPLLNKDATCSAILRVLDSLPGSI